MLTLAQRGEIFFILSSELEQPQAEKLEKKISEHYLSLINNKLKSDIKMFEDEVKIIEGKFVDSKGEIKPALQNVSFEATQNAYKSVSRIFKSRLDSNKDVLIEILRS